MGKGKSKSSKKASQKKLLKTPIPDRRVPTSTNTDSSSVKYESERVKMDDLPHEGGDITSQPISQSVAPVADRTVSYETEANTSKTLVVKQEEVNSEKILTPGNSESQTIPVSQSRMGKEEEDDTVNSVKKPATSKVTWCKLVSSNKRLTKKGTPYTLPFGELCVTIPNEVITQNQARWANHILAQFHGTAPSPGALHNILNGIWSKKIRDITVAKLSSQSFFVRIPSAATRHRVLAQGASLCNSSRLVDLNELLECSETPNFSIRTQQT